MNDVARLAGVSQKTVSRVVNDEPHVSAQVRERVLQAADSLGYRRNTAARALIMGRSHRIGVVSLGTALYGPAALLISLQRAAQEAGYSLTVVTTVEGEPNAVSRAVSSLLDQGVEAIVLSEPIDEGTELLVDSDIPVVSLGRMPGLVGPQAIVNGSDGVAAARTATDHLLSLGHATVWHVAGPQRWWAARDRLDGWRQALAAAGAVEPPVLEGDWTPASGYAAGGRLARERAATAVFVANDDMAIGVVRALTEAGRRVPHDISVTGFDDIPAAAFLNPPLTSVHQDFDVEAAQGLRLLVERLDGPGSGPAVAVGGSTPQGLVVRGSTGPPPRRSAG